MDLRRLKHRDPRLEVTLRAAAYEDVKRMDGWRDYMAIIEAWRRNLEENLTWGRFSRGRRPFGTSDDDIRAMLFVLNRLMTIPAEIDASYQRLRQVESAVQAQREAQARTGVMDELELII